VNRGPKAAGLGTLVALAACALALPTAASATTTLWVSNDTPSAPYDSCEHPGYSHIQQALAGPGTVIHVCQGSYEEQVTIERPVAITGYGTATVKLPASTVASTTPCDEASLAASHLPDEDAISICAAGTVSITDLHVEAIWPGEPVGEGISCAYNLNGILVAGGSHLELTGSEVLGARPKQLNGCQYGVGVQIGMSYTSPVSVGTAKLSGDTITGYNKNGVTVEGSGSQATITKTTVTGMGPTPQIGQNGIGVQIGAKATITDTTVSGDECELPDCGPDALSEYAADGVYFYEAGTGSSITKSTLEDNNIGAEVFDPADTNSVISHDKLENNPWESVLISAGTATIDKDVMNNSIVGVELLQDVYTPEGGPSQAFTGGGTAIHDTIEDMSGWAVLGRSDKSSEDQPGRFTITKSKISGNPGQRPQESVESESPSLKIYAEKDH
jgi:nitrous oxidase accessory protein NosD